MMIDEVKLSKDWRARGFGFRTSICEAGDVWTDEGHPIDEIVMVASGDIEVTIGTRSVIPDLGEELVVPAGQDHKIRNIGDRPARILFGYKTEVSQSD